MYIFFNIMTSETVALDSSCIEIINNNSTIRIFDVIVNIGPNNILYNEMITGRIRNWLLVSVDEVMDGDFYHIESHLPFGFKLGISINITGNNTKHRDIIRQYRNNTLNKLLV